MLEGMFSPLGCRHAAAVSDCPHRAPSHLPSLELQQLAKGFLCDLGEIGMLFDWIGRAEAADAATADIPVLHLSASFVSESHQEGLATVTESKLAPLWGRKNRRSHHCDLTKL